MAKWKISSRISGDCTQNVHNFGQILDFWSGNDYYEIVSNCQNSSRFERTSPLDFLGSWESGKLGR
jgi:hypothetical protein